MIKDIHSLSLLDILPDNLLADKQVAAAAQALDGELQAVTAATIETLHLPRLDVLPEKVLDLLAWQWHVDFYEPLGMSVETKRKVIRKSIAWHRMKGTLSAVEEVVSTIFATNAVVEEWFEYDGNPYCFKITVSADSTAFKLDDLQEVRRLVNKVKNVRSWLEEIYFSLHARIEVSSHIFGYPYFVPPCNTKLCGTYPYVATAGKIQKTIIKVWIKNKPVDYIPPLTGLLPGVMTKGQIRTSEIDLLSDLQRAVYNPAYTKEIFTGKKPENATKGLSAKARVEIDSNKDAMDYIPIIAGLVPEVKSKGKMIITSKAESDSLIEIIGNSQSEQAANDNYTGLTPDVTTAGNHVASSTVAADETATVSYTVSAVVCGAKKSGQS